MFIQYLKASIPRTLSMLLIFKILSEHNLGLKVINLGILVVMLIITNKYTDKLIKDTYNN